MIEIKDLLSRWVNLLSKGEASKMILREVLNEVLHTDIQTEDIQIKNGTMYLNIKPIYKNEILLKREEIFERLENTLGVKAPKDIR